MAHECPECGQMCHCNGDIEDCCNNFDEDVINCVHWKQCETENTDDDNECDCYEPSLMPVRSSTRRRYKRLRVRWKGLGL